MAVLSTLDNLVSRSTNLQMLARANSVVFGCRRGADRRTASTSFGAFPDVPW